MSNLGQSKQLDMGVDCKRRCMCTGKGSVRHECTARSEERGIREGVRMQGEVSRARPC